MRLPGATKYQLLYGIALIMATSLLFLTNKQPGMAQQQERPKIALLIGNAAYTGAISPLKNPLLDIETIKKALLQTGFKMRNIIMVKNGGFRTIHKAVGRYIRRLESSGHNAIGFFYYSGHGAVNKDTRVNYLIPTDVTVTETEELWDSSVQLQTIIDKLRSRAGNATHFVVFDACRNSLKLSRPGSKALFGAKGFEPLRTVRGMLIAYATADGETAADASAYANTLAQELVRPGVEAVTMFREVQLRVSRAIGQEPWLSYGRLGRTYFAGNRKPTPKPEGSRSDAGLAWRDVQGSNANEGSSIKPKKSPNPRQQHQWNTEPIKSGKSFTLATGQSVELGEKRIILAVKHSYAPNGGTVRVILGDASKSLDTGQRLYFKDRSCHIAVRGVTWNNATFRFRCAPPRIGKKKGATTKDAGFHEGVIRSGQSFTLATGQAAELGPGGVLMAVKHTYAPNGGNVTVILNDKRKSLGTGKQLPFVSGNQKCRIAVRKVTWKTATFRLRCR